MRRFVIDCNQTVTMCRKQSFEAKEGKVSISTQTISVVPNTTRTIDQCQIRPQLNYNSKKLPELLKTCLNLH